MRSKLAALVVRRQALTPPRGVEDAAPYILSRELSANRRGGIHPSRAPSAAVNFPGGLGAGRPTSHFTTFRGEGLRPQLIHATP